MNTVTFHVDNILKRLDETLMNLNIPNKLDTGMDTSTTAQNMKTGSTFKNWIGPDYNPGEVHLNKPRSYSGGALTSMSKNVASILFDNNVRKQKVTLLRILKTVPMREFHTPVLNYKFINLMEASNMYPLSNKFFQSFGDAHNVYVEYKGALATVVSGGTYRNYLTTSQGNNSSTHEYLQKISDPILQQIKQKALQLFKHPEDIEFINTAIGTEVIPSVVYDGISLGVIDTANLNISNNALSTSPIKNILPAHLRNKASVIMHANYTSSSEFASLSQEIINDLHAHLHAVDTMSPTVYSNNIMDDMNQVFQLSKRDPSNTYRTIYKSTVTVCNWIVNDLNNAIDSSTNKPDLYFSNPPMEKIIPLLKKGKNDNMPFIVVRALTERDGKNDPLQIRCFGTECQKRAETGYKAYKKVNKVAIIPPGFNNYITSKANGAASVEDYINQLRQLLPSEANSYKGSSEGTEIFYTALRSCYAGNGKFKSMPLFKYLPPILYQDTENKFELYTSFKDLSMSALPYMEKLKDKSLLNAEQFQALPRNMNQAAFMLFVPLDKQDNLSTTIRPIQPDSVDSIEAQRAITMSDEETPSGNRIPTMIPMKVIREQLSKDLDRVRDLNDLMTVSTKFSIVLKNLSRGFWTAKGGTLEGIKNLEEGTLLGMYNILLPDNVATSDKPVDIDVLGGRLNILSLQDAAYFKKLRDAAIESASASFSKGQ
jgi:hypothetical protein